MSIIKQNLQLHHSKFCLPYSFFWKHTLLPLHQKKTKRLHKLGISPVKSAVKARRFLHFVFSLGFLHLTRIHKMRICCCYRYTDPTIIICQRTLFSAMLSFFTARRLDPKRFHARTFVTLPELKSRSTKWSKQFAELRESVVGLHATWDNINIIMIVAHRQCWVSVAVNRCGGILFNTSTCVWFSWRSQCRLCRERNKRSNFV